MPTGGGGTTSDSHLNKKGNTKSALIMSVLSLVICCLMLIGTTFAWFTDSASTGINNIIAGNLDMELLHSNGVVKDEYVTENTKLFVNSKGEEMLWEPGAVCYENLTVSNVGNLALQYKLSINVGAYNTVFVNGTDKSLKDVLKVAVVKDGFSGDRLSAQSLEFTSISSFEKEGVLPAGNDSADVYGIVIYWEPGTDDNDYNLNNSRVSDDGQPLYIDMGLRVIATQTPYEYDSYDNQYDKQAWDSLMEEENRNTIEAALTGKTDNSGVESFKTPDSTLFQLYPASFLYPGMSPLTYSFTVSGSSAKDRMLSFDFGEKCGAGGTYKDYSFEYGFGGFEDVYVLEGDYTELSGNNVVVCGDYYPIVVTVTPAQGNKSSFSYTGSLTGLVNKLSKGIMLKGGIEYNESFTVTVDWPFETECTDDCYVLVNGKRQDLMDYADSVIGNGVNENIGDELWADVEVSIK